MDGTKFLVWILSCSTIFPDKSYIYLVHSFYAPLGKETIAMSEYALSYSAALQKDNFYGVQFHPEKSSDVGSEILNNFLTCC